MTQEEALSLISEAIDYMIAIDGDASRFVRCEMWPGETVLVVHMSDGSRFGVTCSPLREDQLR